jgi:HEAT repeat protein
MTILLLIITGVVVSTMSQTVVRAPDGLKSLPECWEWAVREAGKVGGTGGVWIGYSIQRLMSENSWIGSFNSFPEKDEVSLYELITGRQIEFEDRGRDDLKDAVRKALSRAERKKDEKKVLKEVAFLFEFRGSPADLGTLRTIRTTNITLRVDLDGLSLLWLGTIPAGESVTHLKQLLHDVTSRRASEKLIQAIGLHGNSPGVFEELVDILKRKDQASAREEAAFWLGQLDTISALKLLVETARNDESKKVAEKAIFAISQMTMKEATETLIDLGRNGPSRETRKKAVFWLGQHASRMVIDTLENFVYKDKDEEIQKQAVFALTQLPDNEGVALLIRVAKTHPSPRIRKQAVFWLGECDDPRAFEAIVEIARGKK